MITSTDLRKIPVQKKISMLDKRLTDGVHIRHAIKRTVAKHKPEFEGLFQELEEDSDEDPEEEDPDLNAGMA